MKCVLDIHVRHLVQEVDLLHIGDHRHQLYHVDLKCFGMSLHSDNALSDDVIEVSVDKT